MSRRGWVLFAALSVLWGVPYLFIKIAVEQVTPAELVFARCTIAALLLLPLALRQGELGSLARRWRPLLVFAAVEICIPWLLLGFAEQRLSSSLTGLLIAAVPIVGALIARLGPAREHLSLRRIAGLVVGLAGVGTLVGLEVAVDDVRALVAVLVVAVCYASGPMVLSRHLADAPGVGVITVSLAFSALVYLPVAAVQASRPGHVWPEASTIASVLVLAVVCTATAFVVFLALVDEVGPVRTTVITYVNPAVALLLGVVVLDEKFTVATAVGFGLILVGSVLATSRDRGRQDTDAGPVEPVALGDVIHPDGTVATRVAESRTT